MTIDAKHFDGGYLLFRSGPGQRRAMKRGLHSLTGRHPDIASAKADAARLLQAEPALTFVIVKEVARVRMLPPAGKVKP